MYRTIFNAVKAFPESHLTQDVKRDHLEPADNIDSLTFSLADTSNFRDKPITTALHNMLLSRESLRGKGGDEGLLLSSVLGGISLLSNTRDFITCPKDVIKLALD